MMGDLREAVSKYGDALPLYRQERIFERLDIELSRATLSQWMIGFGILVKPLINLLREGLLEGAAIHCDETTAQVLNEPGKPQWRSFRRLPHAGFARGEQDRFNDLSWEGAGDDAETDVIRDARALR
jgi:hypothetical protein